ncbi:MAG: ABC transporter substrate-binding protein [Clostridia bacterium]|nr:ABC transporter substrate-binding protein [Clostridia bacterium]
MKKLVALLLAAIMVLSLAAAALADGDRKLVIYSAVYDDETQGLCKRFEEVSGIKTSCVVLGGGEILARVQNENENATASVWFGGPADPFITAKNQGLLLAYESPNAAAIEGKYKDPDNYWTGVYIGYVGFVCNNERLAELGMEAPDSWEDLLDPRLKGEIKMASPAASSTGYVILATVLQLMGVDEGFDYMGKLDENILEYTTRGGGCITDVIAGEIAVGICFCHDAITQQLNGYADLLTVNVPEEGTGYETGAMAIIANGPDQEEAKEFYDWALTADCQNIYKEYGALQFLTAPGAETHEAVARIADAKTIEYDTAWAGEHKEEFTSRWAQITGR